MAGMSATPDLWPDQDSTEETLTVPQVGQRLERSLATAFPEPFWMVGEASGLGRARGGRGSHWYFTLVDDQGEGARRASLSVIMWRSTVSKLFGSGGRLTNRLDPTDGVVLRVLVKPNWYGPRGQISFVIEDVDPEFTLGNLDRERRELLAQLTADGATTWNKAQRLPTVPLDLGLITSEGSAAHHDVVQTLTNAGIGFRITFCDARTQGAETCASVCNALATLSRMPLDAIMLVRGGGSRLDLSWFDKEEIARAIAGCPLPVLTGIGHEIDTSVADAVAHTDFKTPTAAAEFAVARARDASVRSEDAWARIQQQSEAALLSAHDQLGDTARALVSLSRASLTEGSAWVSECAHRVAARADTQLSAAGDGLARAQARLVGGSHIELLARLENRLVSDGERLASRAERILERAEDALSAAEGRARLLDPERVLQRGFSWLRRADGSLLKDAADVVNGEPLVAVLRDGELPLVHDGERR
ncbi:MAG: exodeoxyribonuclease VII large subunit [Pseudohongiellaceae bacterium]|jgi:exodeoxyribonuclease VII large subunit